VGDGHRAARGNLVLEDWDDASIAPQHVAEAHRDKLVPRSFWSARIANSAMRFVAPIMLVGLTALSVEIRTKSSTPCRAAAQGNLPGAKDVVFDGRKDVPLHHGNMLVGGSMIEN
jgi:hypothetical protein